MPWVSEQRRMMETTLVITITLETLIGVMFKPGAWKITTDFATRIIKVLGVEYKKRKKKNT